MPADAMETAPKWQRVENHRDLQQKLNDIQPSQLRCVRMMGTMIGAAGLVERGRDDDGKLRDYSEPFDYGLVEQTAALLYCNWPTVQSMLVIGSANRAVPVDQAPYRYYTYLFISRVVYRLIHLLQESPQEYCGGSDSPARRRGSWERKRKLGSKYYDQLVIRFSFVPEDILFAQFFYDQEYLVVAATYSWNTIEEIHKQGAYTAVYLENRMGPERSGTEEAGADEPCLLFPRTSGRLVEIFDARFREQCTGLGQEVWTLKKLNEKDYGVLAETPFWRPSDSVLRAFDFSGAEGTRPIELGRNGLKRFIEQIENQIGPSPLAD